ncbi:MAG TPA: type III-A CRISPR-associated RAMP protein Csm4, partial [Ruminococcus sp.]|nr:type III-A CRISPR-associated RAMP protein Csm4 [Ruminococcus sp.]
RSYLNGELSVEECAEYNRNMQALGQVFLQTNVRVPDDPEQDADPYYVGGFRFQPECGLWVLLCAEDEQTMKKCLALFQSLGYSGIGGKRSSGFGRFQAQPEETPAALAGLLKDGDADLYMSLSICLPMETEMETAAEGASYILIRRSGFVASETYAENAQKKNDLHMFAAGSCFKNRFSGDIFDVSVNGSHPVYRYGLPLLISL